VLSRLSFARRGVQTRRYDIAMASVTPFLWFNDNAEEALDFYSKVFSNSEIIDVTKIRQTDAPNGGFVIGTIRIENQVLTIMNGGPMFTLDEAFSLSVLCEGQEEVDYYWNALTEGGEESQCGWLKDQFGVSWQIIPTLLFQLQADPDVEKSNRVREAMLTMHKIECDELQAAYDA
jgi:predicted 3-demethylubiquinone-9 3-methyltransferase (glyoxalase superfamily)